MGSPRVVYDWLLEKTVAEIPFEDLRKVQEEIASGLKNFGHADSWADWYGYLLPDCVDRAFEGHLEYLIEYLVTAFMAVMPDSSEPLRYSTFRRDGLSTIGQAIMAPTLWPDGPRRSTGCLHRATTTPTGYPIWGEASGDFSASMFFCLKYLDSDEIPVWTKSVFAIACPRWRAQILVWLCGAKDVIDGKIAHPAELADLYKEGRVNVGWALSHLIGADNRAHEEERNREARPVEFLPRMNRKSFDECVAGILSESLLSEWLESMMEAEPLFDHVSSTAIPDRLRQLYSM